jgi:hypothetical protein
VSNYIVAAGNDEETGLGGNRSVAKMTWNCENDNQKLKEN